VNAYIVVMTNDERTNHINCLVCGKVIKRSATAELVHMSNRGRAYGPDFSYQVRPADDQGWFEVGPDCYRKVVRAGRGGLAI